MLSRAGPRIVFVSQAFHLLTELRGYLATHVVGAHVDEPRDCLGRPCVDGWNLEGASPERLAFTRGSRCVPAEHLYKLK